MHSPTVVNRRLTLVENQLFMTNDGLQWTQSEKHLVTVVTVENEPEKTEKALLILGTSDIIGRPVLSAQYSHNYVISVRIFVVFFLR